MIHCRASSLWRWLLLGALLGCAQGETEPDEGVLPPEDTGFTPEDASVEDSGGPEDTGPRVDSRVNDTGSSTLDTGTAPGMDVLADSNLGDTVVVIPDAGFDVGRDTGIDAGSPDTGTTPADTGFADTGTVPMDTGFPDTGFPDTGFPDTGTPPVDTGTPPSLICPQFPFSTQECRPSENCCFALSGVPTGCGCLVKLLGCVPRGGPGC